MGPTTRLEDLRRRLDDWWVVAVERRQQEFARRRQPSLSERVSELDARSFLRGLDETPPLYEIVDGYLQSAMLASRRDGSPKQFHLFEVTHSGTQLRDETFAHYGAASELVFEYGWSPKAIESEPLGRDGLSKGSLDLLVRGPLDGPLAVEAKGDRDKLNALIRGINSCTGSPGKGHGASDHKKCQGLALFRPNFLWGVACGWTRELFQVEQANGLVRLIPFGDESVLQAL